MFESRLRCTKGQGSPKNLSRRFLSVAELLVAATFVCLLPKSVQAQTNYQVLQSVAAPSTNSSSLVSALLLASDGILYGVTSGGGTSNLGTLFRVGTNGSGSAPIMSFNSTTGSAPLCRLVEGANGWLYGTTSAGGSNGLGTVFQVSKDGTGFVVLHHFGLGAGDGGAPQAGLAKGGDGVLYGTTANGGSGGVGTVFKLNQDGSGYSVLHSFIGFTGPEGCFPFSGVLPASDGALYGTTAYGGANGLGVLFKLNTDGTGYTVIHNFMGPDGRPPLAELIEGTDGLLYGASYYGGTNDSGTVFSLSKDGTGYRVLYNFAGDANGGEPFAGLVQGADGALFGTTSYGGAGGLGNVFRLNTDSSGYTVLHSFTGVSGDGAQPAAALALGGDGALYGSTQKGGSYGGGTVFKLFFDPVASTPLVINLIGSSPLTNSYRQPFVDPGATAWQSYPGLACFKTNSTVNPNVVGQYCVQYIATDLVGNSATNTRTVVIQATNPPVILSQTLSAGGFHLNFSGPDGQSYHVLATTNPALPLSSWTVVTSGTFAGGATFLDTSAATNPARFYRIRSP